MEGPHKEEARSGRRRGTEGHCCLGGRDYLSHWRKDPFEGVRQATGVAQWQQANEWDRATEGRRGPPMEANILH